MTPPDAALATAVEHGIPAAVRRHGVDYQSVYRALRDRGMTRPTIRTTTDERLADAYRHATPGVPWTQQMIADALGTSQQAVKQMTDRALKKFRAALRESMHAEEWADMLREWGP